MSAIRTRFPPSPTGDLHIGSVRTALYSWLYARHHQGKMILRIEDTDIARSTEASVTGILEGLSWLGLNYDEGPFFQSQRFDRYKSVIADMVAAGTAYRCYCTKDRLDALRAEQTAAKIKPRYNGHCRHNTSTLNAPFVVRFANPDHGQVVVDDAVHGKVVFENTELDDLIIARSDSTPTYNLTVVVDDWDMGITHVIRGDDHLNNTPRQINLLLALKAPVPIYAHIPMILGSDGKRLSKRHGAASILHYRDEGYLPEAMLNYLVRLGWSHGDQEIFSIDEMIAFFDLSSLSASPAAINVDKLLWLNQHYLKTLNAADIANRWIPYLEAQNIDWKSGPALEDLVIVQRDRAKTLKEMAINSRYFFETIDLGNQHNWLKEHATPIQPAIEAIITALDQLTTWDDANIHEVIAHTAETHQLKLGKIAQPMRVLLTGGTVSPPINVTLRLLGKIKALTRLKSLSS